MVKAIRLSITIPPKLDKIMEELVNAGFYTSKTDIINEALRHYAPIEKELRKTPIRTLPIPPKETPLSLVQKLRIVVSTLKEFNTLKVKKTDLLKALETKHRINSKEANALIGLLLREGTIYSAKEGYLTVT